MKKVFLFFLVPLFLFSCKHSGRSSYLNESKGGPFELFVIAPREIWKGPVGDTLRSVFGKEVEGVYQYEPSFDLLSVPREQFKGNIERHRNLLVTQIGPQWPESSMTVEFDTYARPQMLVRVKGPSADSVAAYVSRNRDELLRVYEVAERDRFVERADRYRDEKITETIQEMFGFTMDIPKGYKIRNVIRPDFLWISNELPVASQGIIIYSYPYDSTRNINPDYLVARRDEFVRRVPGPSDGSYMITSTDVIRPEYKRVRIAGRTWAEVQGQWQVANDYMGGPFVSYTTRDRERNTLVTIDFYVYSPKYAKRNYLRQLESFVYTVKFPGDTAHYVPVTGEAQEDR